MPQKNPPVIVTGAAGFIGFHVARRLLEEGRSVIGVDNLNAYYDVSLKEARLAVLQKLANFDFRRLDLSDRAAAAGLFAQAKADCVIHLAAQPGVRYSIDHPEAYVEANLVGFANVLEGCRRNGVAHLVYASSSSVYGANAHMPFATADNVDHPLSFYAATKKANELMAHSYSHLYRLPTTGLRFFTVYGPWGRPDMAVYGFTRAIFEGRPIEVFNHGDLKRDFTYIDDIVAGIVKVAARPPAGDAHWNAVSPDPASSAAPYRIYNIGNNNPVALLHLIETIETATGRKAQKIMRPMQPGDVYATYADVDDLMRDVGFRPATPIEEGIARFVAWYREFHAVG